MAQSRPRQDAPAPGPDPVTADHDPDRRGSEARHRRRPASNKIGERAVVGLLALAGFVALVVLLEVVSIHSLAGNSDGATVVLEGQAIAQGHLTLHGWALSSDSFWTVDALVYAVAVLVLGLNPILIHLVPALIAACVVSLGAVMAYENQRGRAGAAGAVTVVALLALPSLPLAEYFLQGPLHVATMLWCLVAFFALRRGRFGAGFAVAVLFLAGGLLGDLQTFTLGVVPVFLAGLVAMLRCRDWREGAPSASAAVAAVVLAAVVREVAKLIGTFTVAPENPVATLHQMLLNLRHAFDYSLSLAGVRAGPFALTNVVPSPVRLLHLVGVAVAAVAVVAAIFSLARGAIAGRQRAGGRDGPWRLDDVLLISLVGDVVTFAALSAGVPAGAFPSFARYLTAGVVVAAILAGRYVSRMAARLNPGWAARSVAAAGLALVAAFAVGMSYELRVVAPNQPASGLGSFLTAHDLRSGIGDYWSASIVTVESKGAVSVRPVVTNPEGRLVRWDKNSLGSWYAGRTFQFIVYNRALPFGGVDRSSAVKTYGPAARTFDYGTYVVLVWAHPVAIVGAET